MAASSLAAFIAQFAATGRIGGLHVGMDAAALGAALRDIGIDHQYVRGADSNDKYGSLDLALSDDRLVLLGLDHDGDLVFELPGALGTGIQPGVVPRELLQEELMKAGCQRTEDPSLTFSGQQSALRTEAGVSLVFARPSVVDVEMATDTEHFVSAYMSLARPRVDS
ncbi:MAG TPA: hypothetical protein VL551_10255 [Actinospica sp.]|jgi:hypothetical protein|nr:hypothetical protein [Actinospica sp.]